MNEQLAQLQDLEVQLHKVRQEFAQVAEPLGRISYSNNQQRRRIGAQFCAIQARWELVAQQILQVLATAKGVDNENQ